MAEEVLAQYEERLGQCRDQAEAVEFARGVLLALAPRSLVGLTPRALARNSTVARWGTDTTIWLRGTQREYREFCLNRDFMVWVGSANFHSELPSWLDRISWTLDIVLPALPLPSGPILLGPQRDFQLAYQQRLRQDPHHPVFVMHLHNLDFRRKYFGPAHAEAVVGSIKDWLRQAVASGEVIVRYRLDRFAMLLDSAATIDGITRHIERRFGGGDVPIAATVGMATGHNGVLAALEQAESAAGRPPGNWQPAALVTTHGPGDEDCGPGTLAPLRPRPGGPRLIARQEWPEPRTRRL